MTPNKKRRTVLHELRLRDFSFGGIHCYSMKAGLSRFRVGDEITLQLIATNMTVNIERLLSENAGPLHQARVIDLLNTCKDTLVERKHEIISQIIKKGLCRVFKYEASSILYYDKKEDVLFSVTHDTTYDGITFIKEYIRYPSNIGITGSVMKRKDKQVFNFRNTKKNGLYKPEIDNVCSVH